MSGDNVSFVWAGVTTVVATLASAVAYLFKLGKTEAERQVSDLRQLYSERNAALSEDVKRLKEEATECRRHREELRVSIARLEERLAAYIAKHGGESDVE